MRAVAKKVQMIRLQEQNCMCQAVQLFNQGMEYPAIAKKVGCNVSSLYRELKKRGILQMPK